MSRPTSYVDLLNNLPYSQQIAPGGPLNNASLQTVVGSAASLLDTKKTLDMYRANVKKTTDAAVQYEFAIFMINAARDLNPADGVDPTELTNEAKHILQRLADRAYPFAQYYLADGFSSGLFNKGKPDLDKSFTLFVAASKHGHAEAGYRAALCYEFGWGCAKSYPKAVQFYRNSASKNHPGAATRLGLACISGDMGLKDKYREGVKWLKRAQESADFQYNAGPYELGIMHLTGHGEVIFKDEAYAAQLFTQSAELGHVHANFLMGQAYENGLYGCPRDAALSVHFYNGAATRGHAEGQMALCAWYMVGAEPVLEKDENEAYQWAKQAAESGE
jgi:TPR repeat protein